MRHLVALVDREPVGVVVAREHRRAGARHPSPESGRANTCLRLGDAILARNRWYGRRRHGLGLVIERAQKLALPAVPHARSDGADVGDGEDQEKLQALRALHDMGEIEDGLEVVEVAHLRRLAHQQMMADEPGDRLGLRRRQAEARAQRQCDPLAGDGVMLVPALGDVVEKGRDIERAPAGQRAEDLGRERVFVAQPSVLDIGKRCRPRGSDARRRCNGDTC